MIGFDTETYLIAPGRLAPRLVCLSTFDGERGRLFHRDTAIPEFRRLLESGETLVAHNAAFDVAVMAAADPSLVPLIFDAYRQNRIFCTQVNENLRVIGGVSIARDLSLAGLVKDYLGVTLTGKGGEDAWRFRYSELEGVPAEDYPPEARDYAILDAHYAYKIAEVAGAMPDAEHQIRAAFCLHLMGCWGVRTDADSVAALALVLETRETEFLSALKGWGFVRENGTKDMAVIRAAVEAAYMGEPPLTEKGAVSTSAETLRESGDAGLGDLADYGEVTKLKSAFLPVVEQGTKLPICPRWNVLVNSGRTSCSGPNLQQLPRAPGVRECFVPRPGNVFFGADYSVAELRSLAQVLYSEFGYSKMRDALLAGRELHLHTAADFLYRDYDAVVEAYKNGDKDIKHARQLAKVANFGYPGGLSPRTFVGYAKGYGLIITEEQAATLKVQWLAAFPEMEEYFKARSEESVGNCYTVVQPWSGRLRANTGYCDGLNTRFQGLTADGAKQAMWLITQAQYNDRSSPLYGTRTVAFIHDEFLCEGPEETAPEAAEELARLMVVGMSSVAPDVPHEAEPYLSRRWTKEAGTLRDPSGRLIPYE